MSAPSDTPKPADLSAGTTAADVERTATYVAQSPPPLPKRTAPPVAADPSPAAPPESAPAAEEQEATTEHRAFHVPRRLVMGTGAFFSSTVFHLVVLVVMALVFLPEVIQQEIIPLEVPPRTELDEEEERLLEQRLDETLTPSTESAVAIAASEAVESGSGGIIVGRIAPPTVEQAAVGEKADVEINIDSPVFETPPSQVLISEVPAGMLGDPREIVDNYQEAMDRITRELLMMLDKRKVLVVWSFDQSESMKDDQREIRDRIERVYAELGLSGRTEGGALLTGVTSYGQGFRVHTEKPTARVDLIRQAIASVPNDPSGKEMMCNAIAQSVALHRNAAKGRQMVLILVTDETGERLDNIQYIETAIAEAKAAGCIVYVLGREAVFGYPYAHMRWDHPGTGEIHWLPVDRGPETGFVEQLQTNGFHRRHDAFPSGFGPYEQTRLARETGGIFFMLPGLESSIVRGEERRYALEAMRAYRPDLRSRLELSTENQQSLLRTRINEVIGSLNPYNDQVQPHIEMRVHFSIKIDEFLRQSQIEKVKSLRYLDYLIRAEKVFDSEEMRYARTQETSPRWQANYDLLFAQIIAYKVRIYEYAAYLAWFERNPKRAELTRSPNLNLVYWTINTRKETLTGEETASMIEQSRELFKKVIADHPGTPWAARAQWELNRGFGVELVPDYRAPLRPYTGPPIPIPKL
jgi:hypothetical protein